MDKLLITSFIGAAIGMLGLLAVSRGIASEEIGIDDISEKDVGRFVLIRGRVAGASESNGNYFLSICSKKCIRLTVFRGIAREMSETATDLSKLKWGWRISAEGVVSEYKGALGLELLEPGALQVEAR